MDPNHGQPRDKVPYAENHQKLLQTIGFDIFDEIPDEHEADSEFVQSRRMQDARGSEGTYTGCMRGNKMHGKGTMLFDDGARCDGLWNSGKLHGKGRNIWSSGASARQGIWDNDSTTEGMMSYFVNGRVEKYTNGRWVKVVQN